jgi:hypothetical protein
MKRERFAIRMVTFAQGSGSSGGGLHFYPSLSSIIIALIRYNT